MQQGFQRWFCLALLSALLTACVTSPTGRSQLLLMPESQVREMGMAAFTDLKGKGQVNTDPQLNQYVSCIADAITRELPAGQIQRWDVTVFDGDSANAFALPGGNIGVYTGLLKVATTQHQLAAVIGHEVGHVLSKHSNERMSIAFASQTAQQVAAATIKESAQKGTIMAALGVGAQLGVQLPFSRTHEAEADVLGLKLMAQAGFDPRASIDLWQSMNANSKGQPLEFLSTHPSHATRIDGLGRYMPKVLPLYETARAQGKTPRCR